MAAASTPNYKHVDGTTGSTGGGSGTLESLNGLTEATQVFAAGTSGTDFAISSLTDTHTFNLPNAGAAARGVVSTGSQTFAGQKTFSSTPILSSLTATTVPYLNGSKELTSSAVTPTELGYLSGVTSAIQTQLTGKINDPGSVTDRAIVTWSGTGGADVRAQSAWLIDSSSNMTGTTSLRIGAASRVVTPSFGSNAGFIFLGNNSTSNDAIVIGNHASSFGGDSFLGFCRGSDGGLTGLRKAAASNEFWFGDWAGSAIWETNATNRKLGVQVGTASGSGAGSGYYCYAGGTLKRDTTQTSSTGDATDLTAYTVTGNALGANGAKLIVRASGTYAANGNTKEVRLYYGSISINGPSGAWNGLDWFMELHVIRTGASTQKYFGVYRDSGGGIVTDYGTGALTLSSNMSAKGVCQNQDANGDIVQEVLEVEYEPPGL